MPDLFEEQFKRGQRNAWVQYRGIQMYFRMGNSYSHNADYELANMDSDNPGSGDLTAFFEEYGNKYTFFIENILNERLVGFFEKRDFRVVGETEEGFPPSMISENCWHIRDAKTPSMR